MADLITHACTALLWKGLRGGPHVAAFTAGALLPDLLARVPPIGLTRLHDRLGVDVPEPLIYGWLPLHLPLGMALSSVLAACLFPAEQRRGVFGALLGGQLLHLAVDLLQHHFTGGYALLYPLSMWSFELGLLGSEDTVFLAPILVVLTALVWRKRRARHGASPPAERGGAPGA